MRPQMMILIASLLPTGLIAQDRASYDGAWEVQLAGPTTRVVTLTLRGDSGTLGNSPWVNGKFGQCFTRSMPVTVIEATPNALTFEVTRSKVIPGCPDTTYKLTRVDGDKLEGSSHRDDVTPDTNITLVRTK